MERRAAASLERKGRTLFGYAARFGQPAPIEGFTEIILPGLSSAPLQDQPPPASAPFTSTMMQPYWAVSELAPCALLRMTWALPSNWTARHQPGPRPVRAGEAWRRGRVLIWLRAGEGGLARRVAQLAGRGPARNHHHGESGIPDHHRIGRSRKPMLALADARRYLEFLECIR